MLSLQLVFPAQDSNIEPMMSLFRFPDESHLIVSGVAVSGRSGERRVGQEADVGVGKVGELEAVPDAGSVAAE